MKQIECTKPFYIGIFIAFFDLRNHAIRKTNSSGKALDTRQKYYLQPWITTSFQLFEAWCFQGVTRVSQGYLFEVSRMFQGCFKEVLRMLTENFKDSLIGVFKRRAFESISKGI